MNEPKKRGRPRKVMSAGAASAALGGAAASAPKRRGRPPKAAAVEAGAQRAGAVASNPQNPSRKGRGKGTSDALVGFEEKLWQMADKLRNNMDAAEYKHVVSDGHG